MGIVRVLLAVVLLAAAGCGRRHPPVQPVVPPLVSPVQASWLGGVSTRVEGVVSVRFVPAPRSEDVAARVYWEAPNADPGAYFVGLDKQGMPLVVDRRHRGMTRGFVDEFRRNLERVDKWVVM